MHYGQVENSELMAKLIRAMVALAGEILFCVLINKIAP